MPGFDASGGGQRMKESVKRPDWVKSVVVIQFSFGVVLLGLALLLLTEVYPSGGSIGGELLDQVIKQVAAIGSAMGLLALVGGLALLTNKLWGWWLALLSDLTLMSLLIYRIANRHPANAPWESATGEGCFVAALLIASALLLIRPVRTFYWRAVAEDGD
jgi:hypothetical protein